MEIKTSSEKETKRVAEKFIEKEIEKDKDTIVIALKGELGSGKTTFIKGISEALNVDTHVTSPTFLIIQKYPLDIDNFENLFHIDAYRLESAEEILKLDFENLINKKGNIVVVEWAGKIKSAIPEEAVWIELSHGNKSSERVIEIKHSSL